MELLPVPVRIQAGDEVWIVDCEPEKETEYEIPGNFRQTDIVVATCGMQVPSDCQRMSRTTIIKFQVPFVSSSCGF